MGFSMGESEENDKKLNINITEFVLPKSRPIAYLTNDDIFVFMKKSERTIP